MTRTAPRLTTIAAVMALVALGAPPAQAQPASIAAIAARPMSPASEAQAVSTEARSLRRDVAALLQRYIDDYRDRFTDAEIQQLQGYRADADRKLASVVITSAQLRSATARRQPSAQILSSATRALTAWTRAKAAAESSWASASTIMEPRLSIFEKLGAANDYNAMMDRFDRLGDRIKTIRSRAAS